VFHVDHSGFGPGDFLEAASVSRETLEKLSVFVEMLVDWNPKINLVSATSLKDVWHRHVYDSAQLFRLIPKSSKIVLDLGSGAGFPGMVLALMGVPGIHLVESRKKKVQFLQAVAQATDVNVEVFHSRIESLTNIKVDVIIARALAPLDRLLRYAEKLGGGDTIQLYLKGRSFEEELTAARKSWNMNVDLHKSQTDSQCSIIRIQGFSRF
jgi:16S rRNA (guanine527-N7)-methyltransferase